MSLINSSKRIFWVDACRVLAIFGVVLIHSSGAVFYNYGKIPNDYWLSATFLDSLARVAVPLFVMISGSLLLKPADYCGAGFSENSIDFMSIVRRIVKVLLPLIVWSMFYLWWIDHNTPDKSINPTDWLQSFFSQPAMYHLWFVYMIVGLYILLPILQVIFKACETNERFKWYFLAVWLATNSLNIYIPMPFIVPMQMVAIFGYGGYFILGGLLSTTRRFNAGLLKYAMFYLIGVLATFLITWIRTKSSGAPDELAYSYFSPNVVLASIGAFMLAQKIRTPSGWGVRFVQWASDACFFVYFIHVIVLEFLIYGNFGVKISTSDIHPLLSIPMLAIATFVFSMIFAGMVRLIPGSRRFFG